MQKEFTPFEQSLDLKELGFNEQCLGYYDYNKDLKIEEIHAYSICRCSAPTFSQAFRWFREKYNIQSYIDPKQVGTKKWFAYWVGDMDNQDYYHCYNMPYTSRKVSFDTYEEAELDCLIKLIELAKKK